MARARTHALLEPIADGDQARQVDPLMSPLCWDLAHIGHYEELWLLREITDAPATDQQMDDTYDAFLHPRSERTSLPLLDPTGALAFDAEIRNRVLADLDQVEFNPDNPLLADAYVYGVVVQHEQQHIETMLATLQLMEGDGFRAPSLAEFPNPPESLPADVELPGGAFIMGTDDEPWAYDNERPAHEVELAPFAIDTTPVTNAAYDEFVTAGGYDDPQWWNPQGWKWRQEASLVAPQFWFEDGTLLRYGHRIARRGDEPVQHVGWYEADAYARWAGKRLPTEAEWEYAASWDPTTATKTRWPWGNDAPTPERAHLALGGDEHWGPAPVGTHPAGASPAGVHDLIGNVWEWTASDFDGYPGIVAFPYLEYSEVFFGGEYKVLRGGSWAVHPSALRATFRNWDYPIRRQIFSGFRGARDL